MGRWLGMAAEANRMGQPPVLVVQMHEVACQLLHAIPTPTCWIVHLHEPILSMFRFLHARC